MAGINDIAPGFGVASITKGSALPKGRDCRAIWVGTAGTLNFTDRAGNVITNFPALAGLLPVQVQSVQAGGTCSDIWAIY